MNFFLYISIFSLLMILINNSEETDLSLDSESPYVPPVPSVIREYGLFEKDKSIIVSADDGLVQFNSDDFDNDEVMHFKIKALNSVGNFYEEKASYQYISSKDNFIKDNMIDTSYRSQIDFETRDDGTRFRIRYFDITKNKNQFRSTDGSLLMIQFYIKEGVVEISNYEEKTDNKLKPWEIALIVISVIIFISLIIIIIIVCVVKKKKSRKNKKRKHKNNYYYYNNNVNENISELDDCPQEIRIYNRRRIDRNNDNCNYRNNRMNNKYDAENQKYDNNMYNSNLKYEQYEQPSSSVRKIKPQDTTNNNKLSLKQPNKKK